VELDCFRRLRRSLRRRYWQDERAWELQSYLEIETAENLARGMAPQEARRAAHRKLGNPAIIREEIYEMNTLGWLEALWQDMCFGWRLLAKNPGFTAVAILSLALGIGANTAIFQLLDAVRLRSLPIPRPQELADIQIAGGNHGLGINNGFYAQLTRPLWWEIRASHQPFSGVFAWGMDDLLVGHGRDVRHASGLRVSGEFFPVLGIQPWKGRLLLAEDEGPCPASTAVVSYAYWMSKMGGRSLTGGNTLLVNGELMEVVGVTPRGFSGLAVGENFDIALPLCQQKELRRDVFDIMVMGRLKPGWTTKRATAQLDAMSPGLFAATAPTGYGQHWIDEYKRFRLAAYPASGGASLLREQYDSSLTLLLAITGLVLLIACANLANLMLARANSREREVAVRRALGATRSRLVRQLVVESALLALIGALLGVSLAQALSRVMVRSLSTENYSVFLTLSTDWRVLLFAAATAGLTCIVFGVVPALRATRQDPRAAMKSGGRGMTAGREHFSLQRIMVGTQIAVSLVLLVGALLFVRSFRNLMTVNTGMREQGITLAFIGFEQSHIQPDHYDEFKRTLLDEVRGIPGILGAASTTNVPLLGNSWTHAIRLGSKEGSSKFTWVSPGYFQTMNIPILSGRDLSRSDTAASPHVVVVNRTFWRDFAGDGNPLGKVLRTVAEPNYSSTVYEIVGVIPDTKYNDVRGDTPPMAFAPASQFPAAAQGPWTAMMIYSHEPKSDVDTAVKRRLAPGHSEIIVETVDFQARIRDGFVRERLMAVLSGFFGVLAVLLAGVGLYGVISYHVARRRNEIGIRMALGARQGQMIGMVMREAGRLLGIGLLAGTALSLLAGRWASSLLFGLKSYDPVTLASAGLLLGAIAALASFLPARRASQVDPMAALRYE
jgi:putative ABC transport system permease protein